MVQGKYDYFTAAILMIKAFYGLTPMYNNIVMAEETHGWDIRLYSETSL